MHLRPHPRRFERVQQLQQLDPDRDAHTIYRASALLEFPADTTIGLNLAFCRTFAVPRIAALLARTGEIERGPDKRALDTGLFMYELIDYGLGHPRGREVVRALNRMHRRWPISNEDYLYVLSAFVVVPTRWIDAHAWRPTTAVERHATAEFYRGLGRRMHVEELPTSYGEFVAYFDSFERQHVGYSAAGARQMAATQRVFRDRLPGPLKPFAALLTRALPSDDLNLALGLGAASPLERRLIKAALRARARATLRLEPPDASWFTAGQQVRIYPHGYELGDLGPDR